MTKLTSLGSTAKVIFQAKAYENANGEPSQCKRLIQKDTVSGFHKFLLDFKSGILVWSRRFQSALAEFEKGKQEKPGGSQTPENSLINKFVCEVLMKVGVKNSSIIFEVVCLETDKTVEHLQLIVSTLITMILSMTWAFFASELASSLRLVEAGQPQ